MTIINTTARDYLDEGEQWADRIAQLALPILLWVAKKGWKITYGQLAAELHYRHKEPIQAYMNNYGWPVGKIGHALMILSEEWDKIIPPLNSIVVNKQTGLPGQGVDYFIANFLNKKAKRRLNEKNRNALTEEVMQSVWDYNKWDKVATYFGVEELAPVSILLDSKQDEEPIKLPYIPICGVEPSSESDLHQNLKRWASINPEFFSDFGDFSKGHVEYSLMSGDRLDAFMKNTETCLAIEVKASNAPDSEFFRGIFQCVKYRATLRAMQLAGGDPTNAQAVLLVTRKPPIEVKRLAKRLRVEIFVAPLTAEK